MAKSSETILVISFTKGRDCKDHQTDSEARSSHVLHIREALYYKDKSVESKRMEKGIP